MKKFTKNFLHGEYGIGQILRKVGLSVVAVLLAMVAFSQEAQETYHVWAEGDVDACYQYDNEYKVTIYFKDFVKIDSFYLKLGYNDSDFELIQGSFKVLREEIDSTEVVSSVGQLQFKWDVNWEYDADIFKTIEPNNEKIAVMEFKFKVKSYIPFYETSPKMTYDSEMEWLGGAFWNDVDQVTNILTDETEDNISSLFVTQKWADIVIEQTQAVCNSDNVIVTVVSPNETGMEYSWNGDDDYTTNPATNLIAPVSDATVIVENGGCVSYQKRFEVETPTDVLFTVQQTVYIPCPKGDGDIEIDANFGSAPYTYYLMSDAAKIAGAYAGNISGYASPIGVFQVKEGVYWVAVQDANNCVDMTNPSWWKRVEVIDNNDAWSITETKHINNVCNQGEKGEFELKFEGANPPYVVTYGGNDYIVASGGTISDDLLKAGTYPVSVIDSEGCYKETSVKILENPAMSFEVGHTDASCEQPIGTIWIDKVAPNAPTGGSGSYVEWWYSIYPDFHTGTDPVTGVTYPVKMAYSDTAKAVYGGVYYIRIFDNVGCFADYRNVQEDNSVKVLTLDFDVVFEPIKCNGGNTDVEVVLVSGDGSHDLKYSMDLTTWQSGRVFEDISAGTYTIYVKDNTTNGCVYPQVITITEPPELTVAEIKALTLPPTCADNDDGNIQVRGFGGTPFVDVTSGNQYYLYKFDTHDWVASEDINNTFAAGMNANGDGIHVIKIQDAKGCIAEVTVTLVLTPNLIGDKDTTVDCSGDYVTMDIDTISWIHEPVDKKQGEREPKFYFSETLGSAQQIVAEGNRFYPSTVVDPLEPTEFGAGTYYIAGKDEWGCYSNVAEYNVYEPLPLEIVVTPTDAECAEEFGGTIKIEAFNSRVFAPSGHPDSYSRYQYVIIEATTGTTKENAHWDILEDATWYDTQVDWSDFENDDEYNDSVMVADAMKGIYFVAVRDYCGKHGRPELIKADTVVIDGRDEIALLTGGATVTDITCHVWDPVLKKNVYSKEGSIVINVNYVIGGYPPYMFALSGTATKPKQASGTFSGLDVGSYMVTISDSLNCPVETYSFTVDLVSPLRLTLEHVNVSCIGNHDGLLVYRINGGHWTKNTSQKYVSGYQEATNNIANGEWTLGTIPEARWFNINPEAIDDGYVASFNRSVEAGTYQVFIRDKKGCITGPYVRIVEEPAVLDANPTKVNPYCTDAGGTLINGSITVAPTGGWESSVDSFFYTVTLKKGSTVKGTVVLDSGAVYTFPNGLGEGSYTVSIVETNAFITSAVGGTLPYNEIDDYMLMAQWNTFVPFLPFQNSDDCTVTENVELKYTPLDYEAAYVVQDVQCYNTPTGVFKVEGVTGGSGKYQYKLEGPKDYDVLYNEVWLPKTTLGVDIFTAADSFIWDNLVWGHYTLFIRDSKLCEIYRESWEVQNIDSLELQTELIDNPLCHDSLGIVALHADGGTGSGTYKFALVDVSDTKFPTSAEEAAANLDWSAEMVDADTFYVPYGIYIGFVMDANGCIQGFATNDKGAPILIHRVEVDNPTPVVATGTWAKTQPKCHGDVNGRIDVPLVSGGNGGAYTAVLTGTDWAGNDVYEVYTTKIDGTGLGMIGLPASTDKLDHTKLVADDYYTIVFYDSEGCPSDEYTQYLMHPEEFKVSIKVDQEAFVCPDDLAGVFELIVIEGGVPFDNTINKFKYRWEVYSDEALSNLIESTDWAFTSKFQGQAGVWYKGYARDLTGCIDDTVVYINAPDAIEYTVKDVSCFGEILASAKVEVTPNNNTGRTYFVQYEQVTGENREQILFTSLWLALGSDNMIELDKILSYGEQDSDGGHYYFYVKDNLDCMAPETFITFVPVQTVLALDVDVVEGECTDEVTIAAIGGTPPYIVTVDGVVTDVTSVLTLDPGVYVIGVTDAHECVGDDVTVTVTANQIVNSITVTTDLGANGVVHFVDGKGGIVDTTLAVGSHVIEYVVGGCTRILNVSLQDVTGPIAVSMAPQGELVGDDTTFDLVLTLNDNVVAGSGAMKVFGGSAVVAEFDITEVSIAGSVVSVPVSLDKYSTYFVNVPAGFVTDASGNLFAGITDPTTWTFTTKNFATNIADVEGLDIKVYPNPFSDKIYIDNAQKLTRVVISNIAGQRVIDIEYPEREVRTPNLVSGVYIVTMFTESGIAKTERIVKR